MTGDKFMARQIQIKNSQDKAAALDHIKKKIKGLTVPKRSHAHILNLTECLIDRVLELTSNEKISISASSGLGEKTIKISSPVKLPENIEEYSQDKIVSYSTDFLSVKNKDGKGSITITVKGSPSYALLKTFITLGLAILFSYCIKCFG